MDKLLDFIRGIVRPVVTFIFVGVSAYLAIIGKIDPKDMLGLAGIVIAFWFSNRADNTVKKGE